MKVTSRSGNKVRLAGVEALRARGLSDAFSNESVSAFFVGGCISANFPCIGRQNWAFGFAINFVEGVDSCEDDDEDRDWSIGVGGGVTSNVAAGGTTFGSFGDEINRDFATGPFSSSFGKSI